MFSSTIIPTVGRHSLARAVDSVLEQDCRGEQWEVIVVNDSGEPLPPASWQADPRVRILHTNRRERSVARNAGAAVARGRYLHFLDDDDWLLLGALESLRKLAQKAEEAAWLYGGVQFVDPQGKHLGYLNLGRSGNCFVHVMSAVWVPIQASLIKTDTFFAVGGFDPYFLANQDLDLCRRVALGGDLANVPTTVACILRGTSWGSVTDNEQGLEYNRWGRDKILSEPGALSRMRASARDSSFWHGRVFHAYVSSMLLRLRRKDLLSAASRTVFATLSLVLAGRHAFLPDFWRAVRKHTITHDLITEPSCGYASIDGWLK
jgi:glycosyltransferase involved in cell wall biosynthesis